MFIQGSTLKRLELLQGGLSLVGGFQGTGSHPQDSQMNAVSYEVFLVSRRFMSCQAGDGSDIVLKVPLATEKRRRSGALET